MFIFNSQRLGGNICGSYGLELSHQDRKEDICYEDMLYSGTASPGENLALNYWYTGPEAVKMAFQCYFWCTLDGSVPLKPASDLDNSFLFGLVNIRIDRSQISGKFPPNSLLFTHFSSMGQFQLVITF